MTFRFDGLVMGSKLCIGLFVAGIALMIATILSSFVLPAAATILPTLGLLCFLFSGLIFGILCLIAMVEIFLSKNEDKWKGIHLVLILLVYLWTFVYVFKYRKELIT